MTSERVQATDLRIDSKEVHMCSILINYKPLTVMKLGQKPHMLTYHRNENEKQSTSFTKKLIIKTKRKPNSTNVTTSYVTN